MTQLGTFDVEQVLYYSIPGGLFILLALAAVSVSGLGFSVDATLFTAALLATVPVGFAAYQAYHSNYLWIYKRLIWKGDRNQKALKMIMALLDQAMSSGRKEEIAKGILVVLNDNDDSGFSVRVKNVVNSKGACLFVAIIALLMPLGSFVYSGFLAWEGVNPFPKINIPLLTAYYFLVLVVATIFYEGNKWLIVSRSTHHEILVARNLTQIGAYAKLITPRRNALPQLSRPQTF